VRYRIAWRAMPNDLPPWVCRLSAGATLAGRGLFRKLGVGLSAVLRLAAGRAAEPSAAIIDSRTLRFDAGARPTRRFYDGAKRKRGSRLHMALDTLGHLLALHACQR
jgi:hypothetical protein